MSVKRESFDVAEFQVSYTCPKCKTEFVFDAGSLPADRVSCWNCGEEFKVDGLHIPLNDAFAAYKKLSRLVHDHKLPVRLIAAMKP